MDYSLLLCGIFGILGGILVSLCFVSDSLRRIARALEDNSDIQKNI